MTPFTATPMFPLGSVLLPTAALALHVFEPRYRVLARRCIDDHEQFGVVMIERGLEVGGGDVRTSVGCLARIAGHEELPDGRFALMCVGTDRIRVVEWLPDDPHPFALVERWPDLAPDSDVHPQVVAVELLLRDVLGLAASAGLAVAPTDVELSSDPVLFGYQATAVSPLGALDRFRSLSAASVEDRLALLEHELGAHREMLDGT